MRTENGTEIDLEALNQLLQQADVLAIGFTLFPERIIIDTRANDRQGQLAAMVEPVANLQDRYLWLGRHRGAFGAPEAFSFFVWPQTVRGLIDRGVLGPLRARLEHDALAQLDLALDDAASRERNAMASAVRGDESWPAIWQRTPQQPLEGK